MNLCLLRGVQRALTPPAMQRPMPERMQPEHAEKCRNFVKTPAVTLRATRNATRRVGAPDAEFAMADDDDSAASHLSGPCSKENGRHTEGSCDINHSKVLRDPVAVLGLAYGARADPPRIHQKSIVIFRVGRVPRRYSS